VCKQSFLRCHGFGGVLGPWQPGWNCPTNKSAGGGVRQITFGLDAWEGIAFGSAWNALGLCGARERQSDCQGFFGKQQFIIKCSKLNCHMQDLTLFLTTKSAAAAPPQEEGRPGGVYCYVSVCTRNSTLPKKNNFFCCTPHFYPKCTGWKWRRYSEITEMVSFLVLLLSVCLSNAFFSWFVCGKMLTSYLWKEIERFDAFYAGRGTSSPLLCDQTTWFERKFCCSPCRSEKLWR